MDDPGEDTVEAELAKELYQMSVISRNEMTEEIHGLRTLAPKETLEMIDVKLEELDRALQSLPSKPSYNEAISRCSEWVRSRDFRLMFLRAETFDVKNAATRIEQYLTFSRSHFGPEALQRPIYMSDLDKQEQEIVKAGNFQLLDYRDRAGRRIAVRMGILGRDHNVVQRMRVFFYFMCVLAEDIETQRKGAVIIMIPQDETLEPVALAEKMRSIHSVIDSVPVRISAYHVCVSEPQFFIRMALSIVPKPIRLRFRVHQGSPLEWQYSLSSFGINAELLPFTSSGKLKIKAHQKWIKLRKAKEDAIKNSIPFDGIECPNVQDVFFRRGGNLTSRHGNLMLRELLESKYALYRSRETQDEKTQISWWVVGEIERRKGRFLVEGPKGFWVELTNKEIAREKVANSFRDLRKIAIPPQQTIPTDSSTMKFVCLDGRKRMRTAPQNEFEKCMG
ncbi:hypothetical protein IV203_005978 [Nitzschia inconspicua]|uniref:DUF6824 domain-containing protein n=1 Tax=Nitzschia inconspicua TaxID=303405 RepID=A0A9K3KNF3_9STRA|nr:hypothetical protein IV203_005978 [Nitzschia inconspicua]